MTRHPNPRAYRSAFKRLGAARILAIAGCGLVASALTLALAISGVTRTANPTLALRFMPGESLALAGQAEQLLVAEAQNPPAQVEALAKASLRNQALNPRALRVLGYFASARRDEKRARALIQLAERQSRRDAFTQLWLIEDAAQRGDIKGALTHYDIVLRTKPSIYSKLFPILLGALEDPSIRAALSHYIRTDEGWAPQFLTYATANSTNLPALVALVIESGGLKDPEAAHLQDLELLKRLVAEKQFSEARQIYMHMRGASAARLTDIAFDATDGRSQFGPMGWQLSGEADSGAAITGGENGRPALSVFANAATTAAVARKLLFLRPGSYDFAATLSRFEGGEGSQLRWQLRCPTLAGDQPVWSLDSGGRSAKANLSVPQECTVQYLDIVPSGGSGADGLNATIGALSLRPAR